MAGEWKSAPLSELCEQIADCPHSTPLWTNSGVIVLRNQNIRGGRLAEGVRLHQQEEGARLDQQIAENLRRL